MRQSCPSHATQTAVAERPGAATGRVDHARRRRIIVDRPRHHRAERRTPRAIMGSARLPMIASIRAAALARIDAAHSPPTPPAAPRSSGLTPIERLRGSRA